MKKHVVIQLLVVWTQLLLQQNVLAQEANVPTESKLGKLCQRLALEASEIDADIKGRDH